MTSRGFGPGHGLWDRGWGLPVRSPGMAPGCRTPDIPLSSLLPSPRLPHNSRSLSPHPFRPPLSPPPFSPHLPFPTYPLPPRPCLVRRRFVGCFHRGPTKPEACLGGIFPTPFSHSFRAPFLPFPPSVTAPPSPHIPSHPSTLPCALGLRCLAPQGSDEARRKCSLVCCACLGGIAPTLDRSSACRRFVGCLIRGPLKPD